ncbi:hypothetical protein D3C71_2187680 [compost metagenome]
MLLECFLLFSGSLLPGIAEREAGGAAEIRVRQELALHHGGNFCQIAAAGLGIGLDLGNHAFYGGVHELVR